MHSEDKHRDANGAANTDGAQEQAQDVYAATPANGNDNAEGGEKGAEQAAAHGEEEQSEVEQLRAQLADMKERWMRAAAEVENVRRRTAREVEEARKYGPADLARDVLSVHDNLCRALDSVTEEAAVADPVLKRFREGVQLTEQELDKAFQNHNIKRIYPLGEPFDHNYHQALYETESTEQAPGTVAEVLHAGYTLHDRLLRPAMVAVVKAPKATSSEGADEASQASTQDADTR